MDRKMPMFVGGLTGALSFFFLLIFRNWSTVSLLSDVTGSSKALVVVFAVAILVAAVTGALTLLAQPANFLGAMLFGLVPPALGDPGEVDPGHLADPRLPGLRCVVELLEEVQGFLIRLDLDAFRLRLHFNLRRRRLLRVRRRRFHLRIATAQQEHHQEHGCRSMPRHPLRPGPRDHGATGSRWRVCSVGPGRNGVSSPFSQARWPSR